jgi:hypothetical protein
MFLTSVFSPPSVRLALVKVRDFTGFRYNIFTIYEGDLL